MVDILLDVNQAGAASEKAPVLLIVDDEPLMTDMLRAYLMRQGFEVETACNGQEALSLIQENGIFMQAVITDLVMPLMNGVQLAEQLLNIAPKVPVLLATGRDVKAPDLVLPANVVELVQKPYQSRSLVERVKIHLEIR